MESRQSDGDIAITVLVVDSENGKIRFRADRCEICRIERLELPITGVNWWSADAFVRWLGTPLATADKWRDIA